MFCFAGGGSGKVLGRARRWWCGKVGVTDHQQRHNNTLPTAAATHRRRGPGHCPDRPPPRRAGRCSRAGVPRECGFAPPGLIERGGCGLCGQQRVLSTTIKQLPTPRNHPRTRVFGPRLPQIVGRLVLSLRIGSQSVELRVAALIANSLATKTHRLSKGSRRQPNQI